MKLVLREGTKVERRKTPACGAAGIVERIELGVWVAASIYFAGISLWRTFFKKAEEAAEDTSHAT